MPSAEIRRFARAHGQFRKNSNGTARLRNALEAGSRNASEPARIECGLKNSAAESVQFRGILADCKHRRRLWCVIFGIPALTSETNVQNSCVGRKIRNGPIEKLCLGIHDWRDDHRERFATVQRQPKFRFTPFEVDWREHGLPFDPNFLARVNYLSGSWRY